ncbi:MAG: hypothetical protein AB9883_08390 [Acidaminococcaceae bacterium]
MKYKIGIIGATKSVERIMTVSREFEDGIKFIPLPFEDEKEIQPILHNNKRKVDGWLFSGPLPYAIAKEHFKNEDNVSYCQSSGAGLYINCLQIAFKNETSLPRISVDMFESLMDIEQTIKETGLPLDGVYIKYYDQKYDLEEITQFHLRLWQEGKTDGAITALRTVFHNLEAQNVPVYALTLTKQEIYQSLKIITEKVKTSYFKTTQVGSVIIAINQYEEVIEKAKSLSMLQNLEWKLKGVLLPLCNSLNGYLLEKGSGVYEIFSSRGAIEQELTTLRETIQQMGIAINFDVSVRAGVGFGDTVSNAEFNAYRALRNIDEKTDGGLIIIRDDGGIVEAASQEKEVSYDYYSNDSSLLEKLHKAAVGIKTFRKIEATVERMKWDTFTVAQLASQLSVTEQNIRRIISSLNAVELVVVAGEEFAATRGRPGKLYRLNI